MNLREALVAALRRDPKLVDQMTATLRERAEDDTKLGTVVQVEGALEPILAETVEKNPSRVARLGFSTAHVLASLAAEDEKSNHRLAEIACKPGDVIVSEAARDLAVKRLRRITFTKPKRIKIKGLTSRVTVTGVDR